MDNENVNMPEQDNEEGLDVMAMVRGLWEGRKTVLIVTGIFVVLGLVAALTMKRTYTVSTVIVPQTATAGKGGLSSLASLAGIDMGMNTGNGELSPLIYPQIVASTPFRLEMIHTPYHYEKCDTMISMYDYAEAGYAKPTVIDIVKRYTIGLPGVIIGALRGEPEEVEYATGGEGDDEGFRPLVLNSKEQKMVDAFGSVITLNVDKKEGYMTLTATAGEPQMTAELALKALQLLQDEVTRLRVEKSEKELEYIQDRYDEIKKENDRYQEILAAVTDRSQNVSTTRAQIEKNRVQAKYNLSNSIYNEMAKQLEQAKMQVKKDTPVFTVVQPVSIPMKPSNSRAKTLIVWVFLGFVLGCGIVVVKDYWPTLKEKFAAKEEAAEA